MESWPEEKYSIIWQPRTSCLPREKHEGRSTTEVQFCWAHFQPITDHLTVVGKTNPFVCSTGSRTTRLYGVIRLRTEMLFWYGSCWQQTFWAEMKHSEQIPPWKPAMPPGLWLTRLKVTGVGGIRSSAACWMVCGGERWMLESEWGKELGTALTCWNHRAYGC